MRRMDLVQRDMMKYAIQLSKTSDCQSRKVGCVITNKYDEILGTGVNNEVTPIHHCKINGCFRRQNNVPSGKDHQLCRALHAEQQALMDAIKEDKHLKNCIMYVNTFPCVICSKMIAPYIKKIFYVSDYNDELSMEILKEMNVEIIKVTMEEVV